MIRLETGFTPYADLVDIHSFHINAALAAYDERVMGYPRYEPSSDVFSGGSSSLAPSAVNVISRINHTMSPVNHDTLFVIGGQQVGLMGGPLYTFLKAVSCIRLARHLSEQWNRDVRPAFWCATEDHDILEVNRFNVGGTRYVIPHEFRMKRGHMSPVGSISLKDYKESVISFLNNVLIETEYTGWLLEIINKIDFSTFGTQFIHLMRQMFDSYGLIYLDPLRMQHLTAPCLGEIVEHWMDFEQALNDGSRLLGERGFDVPLPGIRLFEMTGGCRVPLDITSRGVQLSSGTVSLKELAAELRSNPERFSPGAALRALCQDSALPVVATIGGPSELLYLWQILPLYTLLGIRHSARFPRISATFLSPSVVRALDKLGIEWRNVFNVMKLEEEPVRTQNSSDAKLIRERGASLIQAIDNLDRKDTPRWLRTARKSISSGVERIVDQLHEEQRAESGLSRNRIVKVMNAILPGGRLQEREVNILQFLNQYGPSFVSQCVDTLDPLNDAHHIARVVPVSE